MQASYRSVASIHSGEAPPANDSTLLVNGSPVGDRGELAAIKALFGSDGGIAISATKSATGHLLGAAGGLEAIFTILALRDQIAPPTLNLENPDEAAAGLDLVAKEGRPLGW